MERRMDEMFRSFLPVTLRRVPSEQRGWVPPVEMLEKEDRFIVKVELPGMKKDEIDISVVGDILTIKGERKTETEVKEEEYRFSERSYGAFFRSITIPSAVDTKKIEATFEDGVLEVMLHKAAAVKPKKIEIAAKPKQ